MTDTVYAIDLLRTVIADLQVATRSTISDTFDRAVVDAQRDSVGVKGMVHNIQDHLITLIELGDIDVEPRTENRPAVYWWKGED